MSRESYLNILIFIGSLKMIQQATAIARHYSFDLSPDALRTNMDLLQSKNI